MEEIDDSLNASHLLSPERRMQMSFISRSLAVTVISLGLGFSTTLADAQSKASDGSSSTTAPKVTTEKGQASASKKKPASEKQLLEIYKAQRPLLDCKAGYFKCECDTGYFSCCTAGNRCDCESGAPVCYAN